MRNCPTKPKLPYGIASVSTKSSPCSSFPILCPLCPKLEPAVWCYNTKYHFGLAHPNADPKKYNHLWDISNFKIQKMKKKWADRHHVPVKQARKLKSAPLVIYDANRSQISPTGRWVQTIICWKVAEIEMSSAMARNLKGYQTKTRLTVTKNWKSIKVLRNPTQIPKSWWAALKRRIFERPRNWNLTVRDCQWGNVRSARKAKT